LIRYPRMHAIIVELPSVIETTRGFVEAWVQQSYRGDDTFVMKGIQSRRAALPKSPSSAAETASSVATTVTAPATSATAGTSSATSASTSDTATGKNSKDSKEVREVAPFDDVTRNMADHAARRIDYHPADFFQDALPAGDLFTLSRVLHDWDDSRALQLLSRVYDALPNDGAILICEQCLNPDKTGPENTTLQSLNMLVQTDGRERSLDEYGALLRQAGFVDLRARRTGYAQDVILAYKRVNSDDTKR